MLEASLAIHFRNEWRNRVKGLGMVEILTRLKDPPFQYFSYFSLSLARLSQKKVRRSPCKAISISTDRQLETIR